jgi:hypothetical protein
MFCAEAADLLLADRTLTSHLRRNYLGQNQAVADTGPADDPVTIYRKLVEIDRTERLVAALEAAEDSGPFESSDLRPRGFGFALTSALRDRPIDPQLALFLSKYRRATLQVSWLLPQRTSLMASLLPAQNSDLVSRLLGVLDHSWARFEGAPRDEAAAVIRRIIAAISEIGYDAWLEDVTAGCMHHGQEGPVGSEMVNVIPGTGGSVCAPILLVATRGGRGKEPEAFSNAMKSTKQHLEQCSHITRLVVVLADTWDAQRFEAKHRRELAIHHAHGVEFLWLLVGSPRFNLSSIAVEL